MFCLLVSFFWQILAHILHTISEDPGMTFTIFSLFTPHISIIYTLDLTPHAGCQSPSGLLHLFVTVILWGVDQIYTTILSSSCTPPGWCRILLPSTA